MKRKSTDRKAGRRVSRIFDDKSIRGIVKHVSEAQQLTTALHSFLPPDARPFCEVANRQGGTLVVVCKTAAWAHRIRAQAPRLAPQLSRLIGPVRDIKTLTGVPTVVGPAITETVRRPHSSASAGTIADVANHINDEPLKKALQRLSRHVAKPG